MSATIYRKILTDPEVFAHTIETLHRERNNKDPWPKIKKDATS